MAARSEASRSGAEAPEVPQDLSQELASMWRRNSSRIMVSNFQLEARAEQNVRIGRLLFARVRRAPLRHHRVTYPCHASQVSAVLAALGVEHQNEFLAEEGLFSVDIAVLGGSSTQQQAQQQLKLAIEVDGPLHFTSNTMQASLEQRHRRDFHGQKFRTHGNAAHTALPCPACWPGGFPFRCLVSSAFFDLRRSEASPS